MVGSEEQRFGGIQPFIAKLLDSFVENPKCLSHLLFVGPPGSGKTTTAQRLVQAFHGVRKHYTGKALFLNSSDERSLEAVRSKVYPFAEHDLGAIFGESFIRKAPKMIIFDEAETLTEQAQAALRPLLDKPADEILIIFLCNSISRIHSSILHRFLRICFETASSEHFRERFSNILSSTKITISDEHKRSNINAISNIDIDYRRGDIRFFLLQPNQVDALSRLFSIIMSCKSAKIRGELEQICSQISIQECITQILFLFQRLDILNPEDIYDLLQFGDCHILKIREMDKTYHDLTEWIIRMRQKLEASLFKAAS